MAEEKLNSTVGHIIKKSFEDAYIEVASSKVDEGDRTELDRNEKCVTSDMVKGIDEVKAKECQHRGEEIEKYTNKAENGLENSSVSSNGFPKDTDIADFKGVKMDSSVEGSLIKDPINSDCGTSDESEDTDELISIRQDNADKGGLEMDHSIRMDDKVLSDGISADQVEVKGKMITSSTPIKTEKPSMPQIFETDMAKKQVLVNPVSNRLSSNLAVMIGDISGIAEGVYSDGFLTSPTSSTWQKVEREASRNENADTMVPSTLDLSDLDVESIDSYREISFQDGPKSVDANKPLENEIEELRKYYEKECQKLVREKNDLVSVLTLPNHENPLLQLQYTEDAKTALEKRCFLSERRNHENLLENRRLQSLCCELERRNRILEADKAILQERNFKIDQERRKTSNELSAVQELLSSSLSDRRHLEDELFYAKKKEFNSSSRLSDSDALVRELRENLGHSKRDSASKDETIRNLTVQKQEIQSNLNDALDQINRLEDASSKRASERSLFHKLLEEYEILYNQHHRIRSLYSEALQKLDDNVEGIQSLTSQSKDNLSVNLPTRGSSYRRKWSVSQTSPSLKEQCRDAEMFPNRESLVSNGSVECNDIPLRRSPRVGREKYSRNSSDSMLAWETSKDTGWDSSGERNSPKINSLALKDMRDVSEHVYAEDEEKPPVFQNGSHKKEERSKKEWVVQNVNGITRFDVVFSPSKFKYEEAERDSPKENSLNRPRSASPYIERKVEQGLEPGTDTIQQEISELERDLAKLAAEKLEIELQLSRLPTGGSGKVRRTNAEKQELLEERLDEVVKYISNIKMTLKRHKVF